MRLAILGSTGHVGRSLAAELGARPGVELVLVARAPERARAYAERDVAGRWSVADLVALGAVEADALVQCAGVGDPSRVGMAVGEVEEALDRALLGWLDAHPAARGVAISSGAVYDTDFAGPAGDATPLHDPRRVPATPGEAYATAKAASEARHRESGLPVRDLRLFSFYTRLLDPSAAFLANDIVAAIRSGSTLELGPADVERDYADPADLADLVLAAASGGGPDGAFDVYSRAPVRRSDLLARVAERWPLGYTVREDGGPVSPTGVKPAYYSVSRRAHALGYEPRFASIETLEREIGAALEGDGR